MYIAKTKRVTVERTLENGKITQYEGERAENPKPVTTMCVLQAEPWTDTPVHYDIERAKERGGRGV